MTRLLNGILLVAERVLLAVVGVALVAAAALTIFVGVAWCLSG